MSIVASHVRCPQTCPSPVEESHGLARLELVINGRRYRARPIRLGALGECRSWKLHDEDGAPYFVTQELDGFLGCTCLSFVARTDPSARCFHINALLAVGLLAVDQN